MGKEYEEIENESVFNSQEEFEEARQAVKELTGRDISEGRASYGSRNVTYVFANSIKPAVIRISPASIKPLKTVYSEMMFIDYLREHMHTVCNPVPFNNQLINTIKVKDEEYYVVVSRKANGASPKGADFNDERLFEMYGEKLGRLHAASGKAQQEGFKFQRPVWLDAPGFNFSMETRGSIIPEDVMEIMIKIRDQVAALPQTPATFGMIHGDMSPINSFMDWDDVWFFDFDDSCYHYYMYDICCFLIQSQQAAIACGAKFNPVAAFIKGYERSNHMPPECWSGDYMKKFFNMRIASGLWLLQQSRTKQGKESAKNYTQHLFEALRGMDI